MPAQIKTPLTEVLGIEHPIIQGGMGWVGCELAAAVSNAGGLGMICAGSHAQADGLEGLRALIRKCKTLTDKPFGVNFLLLSAGNDWLATAKVVIEEGVKVVETAGRPHPKELTAMLKGAGVKVIHKCVTVRHAQSVEKLGAADVLEIAGFDLGGHPGEKDVGNWILLAKAGKELKLPWVAAGGCATGNQLAAALTLGASGVNMGTRFMATKECEVAQQIKDAIVRGNEETTELLMRGYNTIRVVKNKASAEAKQIEMDSPKEHTKNARYKFLMGDNPEGDTRKAFEGKVPEDQAVWSAGQAMGLVNDIPTCSELINRVVTEAADSLSRSTAMVARL